MSIGSTGRKWRPAAILLISALACLAAGSAHARPPQNRKDREAAAQFEKNVHAYMKIHKRAEKDRPKLKSSESAAEIVDRQRALAEKIQAFRTQSKEGDVFTPAVAAYFSRQIKAAYDENAEAIRACLAAGSPLPAMPLKVNATYPENVSYSIMPPTILRHLPKLPQELQYQVVCNDLILRDVEANLVVDILHNAIP
jgi:hypothetical protein